MEKQFFSPSNLQTTVKDRREYWVPLFERNLGGGQEVNTKCDTNVRAITLRVMLSRGVVFVPFEKRSTMTSRYLFQAVHVVTRQACLLRQTLTDEALETSSTAKCVYGV